MRFKWMFAVACIIAVFTLSGCDVALASADLSDDDVIPTTSLSLIKDNEWQYNSEDDVFYQLGIRYCENPSPGEYQELAIFVPGRFMFAQENVDGTWTCLRDEHSEPDRFVAVDAPVVFPVGDSGYAARPPLKEYIREAAVYTSAGCVYVYAGFRGRNQGDLADLADLKAAIRYIRLNQGNIPGDMSRIFCMGMAEGGARAVLLGVTGDNPVYETELKKIGAIEDVSDAIYGVQAWCPAASPEMADEAYEWMMGNTRTGISEENRLISDGMAAYYADYINRLGLRDEDGEKLTLEQSEDGRFQSGSYYEYITDIIERSLNNFLSDVVFPFTVPEGTVRHPFASTFNSASEYIAALNEDGEWVSYDAVSNKASISTIADFTMACKPAVKGLASREDGSTGMENVTMDALSPLYFLLPSKDGYNTSRVAKHFRINTGLWQTATSLCTEANLVAALKDYGSDVRFTAVWGAGQIAAEREGSSSANFISWIRRCCEV